MQLSAVPEIGMMKLLFKSSINYNFRQKLIGLWYFHTKSTLSFCLVIPIFVPSGKTTLTPRSATSSIN